MDIILDHIVPAFLTGTTFFNNTLWNRQLLLPAGSKVLIRAQSGKGKTTLLSYLYGVRKGYKGHILLGEANISTFTSEQWASLRRSRLSMVFQEMRIFEQLTVCENLKLKSRVGAIMPRQQIDSAMMRLGLEGLADRECSTLSMGQQQRIAILRSLIQPFRWLFMDEPFSHLDSVNAQSAMQLISEICEERGAGFIITSLGGEALGDFDMILEI